MERTKFCPVKAEPVQKEQCAWWDIYINECAVLSMMLALWADVDEDDDDDDEEDEKEEKKDAVDVEDNAAGEEFANGDIKVYGQGKKVGLNCNIKF